MSPEITYTLLVAMGLFGLIVLLEFIFTRSVKRFVVQLSILAVVVVFLNITTNFPETRQAFGGISTITAICIMLVCTILGIGAHYFFHLKEKFSWASLLKPLVISPIVLLPLLGSVSGSPQVESVQLISFAFLAFQNGFFWREVVDRAKTKLK